MDLARIIYSPVMSLDLFSSEPPLPVVVVGPRVGLGNGLVRCFRDGLCEVSGSRVKILCWMVVPPPLLNASPKFGPIRFLKFPSRGR